MDGLIPVYIGLILLAAWLLARRGQGGQGSLGQVMSILEPGRLLMIGLAIVAALSILLTAIGNSVYQRDPVAFCYWRQTVSFGLIPCEELY